MDLAKELLKTYQVKSQSENSLEVLLQVSPHWAYFLGHFPSMPVLPAVAIIDISQYFAEKILDSKHNYTLSQIPSLRVRNMISPGDQVQILIQAKSEPMNFNIVWKSLEPADKIYVDLSLQVSQY